MMTTSTETLLFGVDGGGSNCRALVVNFAGVRLGEGKAGPANILTNLKEAKNNIVAACKDALVQAGLLDTTLQSSYACIGVAGGNINDKVYQLQHMLPFKKATITTDSDIAFFGAMRDHDGVVAIIGTGSVFLSRKKRTLKIVGGWGFMISDLGSGARIGRELLQDALLAYDGVRQQTPLTEKVLTDFGNKPQEIVKYAHLASPRDFGTFAPLVLEFVKKNDPTALHIWQGAVASVEEILASIITDDVSRFCLLGGLHKHYEKHLSKQYTDLLMPPLGTALDGAVAMGIDHYFNKVRQI